MLGVMRTMLHNLIVVPGRASSHTHVVDPLPRSAYAITPRAMGPTMHHSVGDFPRHVVAGTAPGPLVLVPSTQPL